MSRDVAGKKCYVGSAQVALRAFRSQSVTCDCSYGFDAERRDFGGIAISLNTHSEPLSLSLSLSLLLAAFRNVTTTS